MGGQSPAAQCPGRSVPRRSADHVRARAEVRRTPHTTPQPCHGPSLLHFWVWTIFKVTTPSYTLPSPSRVTAHGPDNFDVCAVAVGEAWEAGPPPPDPPRKKKPRRPQPPRVARRPLNGILLLDKPAGMGSGQPRLGAILTFLFVRVNKAKFYCASPIFGGSYFGVFGNFVLHDYFFE